MKEGTWIAVEWIDADHDIGWCPHDPEADDVAEPMISIGKFVSMGDNFIVLSHCVNRESADWLGKHRIPLGTVVGVYRLHKGDKIEL